MKPVKNFVLAAILVSSFAFTSFAGDIDVPGIIPPPPRMSTANDDSAPVVGSETPQTDLIQAETSDYLFFEALAALLSMY